MQLLLHARLLCRGGLLSCRFKVHLHRQQLTLQCRLLDQMLLLLLREPALEPPDCRVSCIQLFLSFVDVVWDVMKWVIDVMVALL